MNLADVIILVILLFAVLHGFRQGLLLELATILGAVVALAAAKAGYPLVRDLLVHVVPHSRWVTVVSYLVAFLIVWGLILGVARGGTLATRFLFLGCPNRVLGAILGFFEGALVVELLLYLGRRVPSRELHPLINHSSLAPDVGHLIPYVSRFFPHVP